MDTKQCMQNENIKWLSFVCKPTVHQINNTVYIFNVLHLNVYFLFFPTEQSYNDLVCSHY